MALRFEVERDMKSFGLSMNEGDIRLRWTVGMSGGAIVFFHSTDLDEILIK